MVARWLRSGFAEDAVQVGATDGALGLGHPGALVVDVDLAARLALGLALHAVELAAPGFRHDGLLFLVGCRLDGELDVSVPPGRGGAPPLTSQHTTSGRTASVFATARRERFTLSVPGIPG